MPSKKYIVLILMFCCQLSFTQNPITQAKGVSDPHVRVFNDTIYLYSGHDHNPQDQTWDMRDWRVFSTTNLLDWKLEKYISPRNNYMNNQSQDCWASDASSRNDKYYFYFSDRKRGIGVMSANHPSGDFKDALGFPLVAPMHDPTIFIDDNANETPYIIYGDKSDAYYIAELNDDMISLKEKPKPILINGESWEKAPLWMDKNYLFKHKNTYYLSWGRDYATSKNIYGPYKTKGSFGNGHHLNEFAHGSFFWWKGQFYHIWCYYIKEGFKFRETIITYCHIADNGEIITDTAFLDHHFKDGVGQYKASWDKIEAEWYYEKSPKVLKEGTRKKGFYLSNIKNGDWVKYANVNFDGDESMLEMKFTNIQGSGVVEIRKDNLFGEILATVLFNKNNKQHTLETMISNLKKTEGVNDIYITFKGESDLNVKLDYFKFY